MSQPVFTVKIFRGGLEKPSSVEFHSIESPRVVELTNPDNEFELELHAEVIEKGATHAVDVLVNGQLDFIFLMERDVMFIESPSGETIYSVNRKQRRKK